MPIVVMVAGAALGVGVDITRKFAQNGDYVIASVGPNDDLNSLLKEVGEVSENVLPIKIEDPTSKDTVREVLAGLPEKWQNIDVLINNATLVLGDQLAHLASIEHWEAMIDANCSGLVAMTREILPRMLARRSGTIINLSSAREQQPIPGRNVYDATVAFVHQYTLSLIESIANTGIRATCIAPDRKGGLELLNLSRVGNHSTENGSAKGFSFVPSPIDIANTVYWIATLPAHVNINHMELAQTGELFSPLTLIDNSRNN
jgi:3-hydroxy acid dehydrogenase/malonic semialdehyde reductase